MGFSLQSLSYLLLASWGIALAAGLLFFRRAVNPRLLWPGLWAFFTTAAFWAYCFMGTPSWRTGPGLVLWVGGGWFVLFSHVAGQRRWLWALALSLAGGVLVAFQPRFLGQPVTLALVIATGLMLGMLGQTSWARVVPGLVGVWLAAILYFPFSSRGIDLVQVDILGLLGLGFLLVSLRRPLVRPDLSEEALRWGDSWLKQGPIGMVRGEIAGFEGLSRIQGADQADMQVLHAIQALGRSARRQDRALWLGGGQFLWIAPGIGYEQERIIKERIRAVFSAFPELGAGLSLGWAWGQPGARLEDVMAEAERALAEVKVRPLS